jgi:SET domain-containing protein
VTPELHGLECWLDPLVRVGRSVIEGEGLFATAPFPCGTVLSRFGGRLVTDAELRDLLTEAASTGSYVDTLSLHPDQNLVLPPGSAQHAGNHGCDPNTWWVDPCLVVARRDLDAGEELTLDYATITDDPEFAMACSCGSASCRGRVTGSDWCLPHLREAYGEHWVPVLRERIAGWRP